MVGRCTSRGGDICDHEPKLLNGFLFVPLNDIV